MTLLLTFCLILRLRMGSILRSLLPRLLLSLWSSLSLLLSFGLPSCLFMLLISSCLLFWIAMLRLGLPLLPSRFMLQRLLSRVIALMLELLLRRVVWFVTFFRG